MKPFNLDGTNFAYNRGRIYDVKKTSSGNFEILTPALVKSNFTDMLVTAAKILVDNSNVASVEMSFAIGNTPVRRGFV